MFTLGHRLLREVILLPSFLNMESDFQGRPEAGTAVDPIVVGTPAYPNSKFPIDTYFYPDGSTLIFKKSNYYKTGDSGWILSINNEPSFSTLMNTGGPNRSELPNENHFKLEQEEGSIYMAIEQKTTDNRGYIPYMGISAKLETTRTILQRPYRGFQGGPKLVITDIPTVGDNLLLTFDAKIQTTGSVPGFAYVFFTIEHDNKKYFAWQVLFDPSRGYKDTERFEWNWPYKGSYHYPGALINFVSTDPKTENGEYNFEIDVAHLANVCFPELPSTAKITRIEFSIEQGQFVENATDPKLSSTPSLMEIELSNMYLTKKKTFPSRR